MSITPIQPLWPAIVAGTGQLADLWAAMARVERAVLGFLLGAGKIWDLPPAVLSESGLEVVRWLEQTTPHAFSFPQVLGPLGTPQAPRIHESVVKIFVKLSVLTAETGDLQLKYGWVPVAWDACYQANHTLDGAVYRAQLQAPIQWATGQRYGGKWYTGWLLTAHIKTRFPVGVS